VLHERSMWTERPVHGDPLGLPLHMFGQQRLRFRRSLLLGCLCTRLWLERRLRNRSSMRGGALWVLHVERAMRKRSVDKLPERIMHVLDGGGLSDQTELHQRHLRRVPVERRLWDASVQGGSLQPLLDIHRLQPDQCL
jgi:hypothetical protein